MATTDVNGKVLYYTNTTSVAGITKSDNPIADVVLGSDMSANELYLKAWGCITQIVTNDNSIVLYSYKEPITNFTIQLKVVR